MQCPIDTHTLVAKQIHNLEIDVCSKCGGVWFDEGEFRSAVRSIASFELPEKYQVSFLKEKSHALHLHERNFSCPKDGVKLETLHYDPPSGIYLDRCGECGGIWLDGGEISLVKKQLAPNPTLDAFVRAFTENTRENKKWEEQLVGARFLPFLLFAPAFLVPFRAEEDTQTLPVGVICATAVVLLAVFVSLNTMNPQEFFVLAAALLALWIFGKGVEERLASLGFLLLFFFGSVAGSIVSLVFGTTETQVVVSATSGVSAIMGVYLVLFPKRKLTLSVRGAAISVFAWWYILVWLASQYFFYSYDIYWSPSDFNAGETFYPVFGQSFLSHMTAFGLGLAAGLFFKEKKAEQLSPPD